MSDIPQIRIRTFNSADVNPDGDFVLYWMIGFRRTQSNYSLQRAVEWSRDLKKPLLVFEALRCGYRWASDRLHGFVIQGMAENARQLQRSVALYYPYLEPEDGAGRGLLAELARRSCVTVSDDFPSFFLPRMLASARNQVPTRFELVDSNGILPMRAAEKVFSRAYDFRRFLQKRLRPHLNERPDADPLAGVRLPTLQSLPRQITQRWPAADVARLAKDASLMRQFPIDHEVAPAADRGGSAAAQQRLRDFLSDDLQRYAAERNQPEHEVTSRLSAYLHFGHISVHQVFAETMQRDDWSSDRLAEKAHGRSEGWWGASSAAESFLDELVTWRELGYNMCWQREDYDQYGSLPPWARSTLAEHAADQREHLYGLEQFEAAHTHDPLWNAAQRQLRREGRIHNYLRMLWGKKILEWTPGPEEALQVMIELNNKYALDGRNPNSYSGIFWVLGRYDRAWGPERPIFGKVRYMSSANTARKVKVQKYLQRYAER